MSITITLWGTKDLAVVEQGLLMMTCCYALWEGTGTGWLQGGLQGRIHKFFEGSSFGGEAHLPRKWCSLGGSGGMPPQKIFGNNGCSEVQFGAFLSRNRIATGLTISQTTLALHIALLLHCTWLFSSPAGDQSPAIFAHTRAHFPELRTRLAGMPHTAIAQSNGCTRCRYVV